MAAILLVTFAPQQSTVFELAAFLQVRSVPATTFKSRRETAGYNSSCVEEYCKWVLDAFLSLNIEVIGKAAMSHEV